MLRVITAIIKTFKATFTLTQYMKGPRTTVLNSVFVHTQYLLTVFFSSNQDAKQDTQCQMQVGPTPARNK